MSDQILYGVIDVGAQATSPGDGDFKYVRLQVRFTNIDGTVNEGANVLYGDKSQQVFELVPGMITEPIPVKSLDDIYLRSLGGTCSVAFRASMRAE